MILILRSNIFFEILEKDKSTASSQSILQLSFYQENLVEQLYADQTWTRRLIRGIEESGRNFAAHGNQRFLSPSIVRTFQENSYQFLVAISFSQLAKMTSSNLPYHAGYAKSSRGACQKCDVHIEEGTLRIADSQVIHRQLKKRVYKFQIYLMQTSKFYHFDCFFETHQPTTVKEIEHFGELKQEDQDKIQKKIKSNNYL